jgi:nucleoside-diphosphate-sugar epimerase
MNREEDIVIVTGATGWIGWKVCEWLKKNECKVVACDLSEKKGPWDHFIEIDISSDGGVPQPEALGMWKNKASGAALVHCAGYAHETNETPANVQRFFDVNAKGTERIVEWAIGLKVRCIVYVSSIAFYEWHNVDSNLPLTEDKRVDGKTAYAKSKLVGELAVRESGMDYRIARLATVYGVGDRGNCVKLARALKRRRFVIPGSGSARKSMITVDKAAECLARLALLNDPKHRLMNLGFREAPTLREVCEAFVKECDCRLPRSIPLPILRPLVTFGDFLHFVAPDWQVTTGNLQRLTESTWVDCSKAEELFPDLGEIRFVDGLRESRSYYRDC